MGYESDGHSQGARNTASTKMNEITKSSDASRIKIVVVGDGGTGKTSLLVVFSEGEFPEEYVPTVFENYSTDMKIEDQRVNLFLWDTAGQEDYDRLRPLSYDRADVIVLCYDVMTISSFDNISIRWAPEIRHFCPGVPAILVGCKTDLRGDTEMAQFHRAQGREPVTTEKGQKLAKDIGALNFLECSAKAVDNVHNVFRTAARLGMGLDSSIKTRKSSVLFNKCGSCTLI